MGAAAIAGVVFALVIALVDDCYWGCWGGGVGGDRGVCLTTCMMYTALGEAEDSEEARGGGAVACRGRDNSGCHGGICVCDTILYYYWKQLLLRYRRGCCIAIATCASTTIVAAVAAATVQFAKGFEVKPEVFAGRIPVCGERIKGRKAGWEYEFKRG